MLFLLSTFLAPLAGIVPAAATAPAQIIVGVNMLKGAADPAIHWDDFEEALPCFLTVALMPFTYSIADGVGFGVIAYTLLKLCRGKGRSLDPFLYVITALFILKYILGNL